MITQKNITDFDWLQEHGEDIRVHGNGFLQLDLPQNHRLHIYCHPDIPRQMSSTHIHDHTFGFSSYIYLGRLINVRYSYNECDLNHKLDPIFDEYAPKIRKDQDTILEPTGKYGYLTPYSARMRCKDQQYEMYAHDIHEIFVNELTLTVIEKAKPSTPVGARVYCPHGSIPDNGFDRYSIDSLTLWSVVKETIAKI